MLRLNTISGKLAIVFVMILPILAWQLGKDTVTSFRSYDEVKVLEQQNAAANVLIAGVYEVLLERLATNNALLAEQPAGSDIVSAIDKFRSVAVPKIAAAYADLSAQEFSNKAALLGDLKAAIDKANSYRAKADAAMKQAKAGRDADTVKNLFVSLSDLSNVSRSARRLLEGGRVWVSPKILGGGGTGHQFLPAVFLRETSGQDRQCACRQRHRWG